MQTRNAKTCKVCAEQFQSWSSAQRLNRFCSPHCAAKWGLEKNTQRRLKAQRKERREAKEKLKTRSDWQREAQVAFNAFIRERDYGKPCISCGTFEQQRWRASHFDCGHYRSTGSAPHCRYLTQNAFAQCVRCNRDLSGNTVEMRKGVALRIGIHRLEALEADNTPRKYSIEDLKRIKHLFSRRARNYRKWRERNG